MATERQPPVEPTLPPAAPEIGVLPPAPPEIAAAPPAPPEIGGPPPAPPEIAAPPPAPPVPIELLALGSPAPLPPRPSRAKPLGALAGIIGLAVVIAVAALMGGAGQARPSAANVPTASPSGAAAILPYGSGGATTAAEPYALSLPAGWIDVDPSSPSSQAALDAEAKANPAFDVFITEFRSGRMHYRIAADELTGDVIVSTAIPTEGLTLADIGKAMTAQLGAVPGVSAVPAPEPTQLPAGDALHFNLAITTNKTSGGTSSVTESAYILVHGSTAVIVMFMTPAGGVPVAEPAILDSLVVGPGAVAASPSASPSTSPDAAAAFNASLTGGAWNAHLTVTGEATIDGVATPVTGSVDVLSGAAHTVLKTGSRVLEKIATPSASYVQQQGTWFSTPARNTNSVVGASGFTDTGVETHGGQALHHMVLPGVVVLADTPMPAPYLAKDGNATVEAWADSLGTPMEIDMTARWSQPGSNGPQAVTLSITMTPRGPAAAFAAPTGDQVWQWTTSAHYGYTIAVPSTWEYREGSSTAPDSYIGDDGSFIDAGSFPSSGGTLNDWVSYVRTHLSKWTSLSKPVFDKVSAATIMGLPARQLMYHGTYSGITKYHLDVLAIKDGTVYELIFSVPRRPTNADLRLLQTCLASFSAQ